MEGGRYHIGGEAAMAVLTKDSSGVPTNPDSAPTYSIYNSAGTPIIANRKMPPVEKLQVTGQFGCGQFLGYEFSEGTYMVLYKWTIGGFNGAEIENIEVLPGDGGGDNIAMAILRKPHATFVLRQLTSGKLAAGRNPSA